MRTYFCNFHTFPGCHATTALTCRPSQEHEEDKAAAEASAARRPAAIEPRRDTTAKEVMETTALLSGEAKAEEKDRPATGSSRITQDVKDTKV